MFFKTIQSYNSFTTPILHHLVRNIVITFVKATAGGFEADAKSLKILTVKRIVPSTDGGHICLLPGFNVNETF